MIWLSEGDIASIKPTYGVIADKIDAALREQRRNGGWSFDKLVLRPWDSADDGATFFALPARSAGPVSGIKWLGYGRHNTRRGLPSFSGLIILSDSNTGAPIAVLSAATVTTLRTAATSLIVARSAVSRSNVTVGLLGYGAQARAHIEALREEFHIDSLRVLAKSSNTAPIETFRESLGPDVPAITICRTVEEVLQRSDMVVSSLPAEVDAFVDARHLKDGAFVTAVDLARPWLAPYLSTFDSIVVDDTHAVMKRAQTDAQLRDLRIDSQIGDPPVSNTRNGRTLLVAPGVGLTDIITATTLVELAKTGEHGMKLQL